VAGTTATAYLGNPENALQGSRAMETIAMPEIVAAPPLEVPLRAERPTDYAVVSRAIAFISEKWRDQPALEEIAAHVGMRPLSLQRLFTRWAGLSPKAFLQAVTLDHARALLADSASVLDASYELGLSGPARLHDLFVTHEAMTPGDYKARGEGITIRYGFHPSPFGMALAMVTGRGLAGLAFADEGEERTALADMTARWPRATYVEDSAATAPYVARIFDRALWRPEQPLRVVMIGTDFEVSVWETLLKLPLGRATTYSDIAAHLGRPSAARAVGTAVGRNPISFVVPCHRVLGKDGGLHGYHWGLTRKRAILGWEAGVSGSGG
jgi:AraC family transcriptional regulator of adaptative response/methylated-DNA-[protein]-cysteine methyltransferase